MNQIGYDASHGSQHGGHTDLLVRKDNFVWIGEAKVYRGCAYLWKGFQQLVTRYSTGDYNQKDGGLLIYIFKENAKLAMCEWNDYLSCKNLTGYIREVCKKGSLAFFSTHIHEKSGLPFRTKHLPIMFYFEPKDRE
ncbi:hypothetical protein K9N68_33840 [Kovacikia minuta CCNUW1]|uniref:hypothetical protein n=1 Tax=Kovacikia minuta TaxID=2931930 RepID=UPI001CC9FCFF|nr:hypothetical protein [Kovacikia minuta]UBF26425.1 hypothetical protein K9N68_33840 [Kovacikia minuta CCNUW1]